MKKIICILWLCITPCWAAADKLTVLLDWYINPDHAPLLIAQQQGYFKAQNLEVELLSPADPNETAKLVAAGKADIGIDYEPQYLDQKQQGLPIQYFGNLIDHPLNCLLTLEKSSLHSLQDLRHKRIGSSTGGVNALMLKTMLHRAGVSWDEVEIINVRQNATQALLSGRVDAITGQMRNFEPLQLEQEGQSVRLFLPEQKGVPTYNELIFITQQNRDPAVLKRFLAAVELGVRYLQGHPKKAWQEVARAYPELNNELNHKAWIATLPYFAKHPAKLQRQQSLAFAAFMRQNNF